MWWDEYFSSQVFSQYNSKIISKSWNLLLSWVFFLHLILYGFWSDKEVKPHLYFKCNICQFSYILDIYTYVHIHIHLHIYVDV